MLPHFTNHVHSYYSSVSFLSSFLCQWLLVFAVSLLHKWRFLSAVFLIMMPLMGHKDAPRIGSKHINIDGFALPPSSPHNSVQALYFESITSFIKTNQRSIWGHEGYKRVVFLNKKQRFVMYSPPQMSSFLTPIFFLHNHTFQLTFCNHD